MERITVQPRPDYRRTIESQGFLWHDANQNGEPYWDEGSAYSFTTAEVDEIEKATYDLNEKALEAVEYVLTSNKSDEILDSFEIYEWMRPIIRDSWKNEELTIIGRFDLSYDGTDAPKLLEYNADTPTGLVEAAVIQWHWLQDMQETLKGESIDQFNSLHERLIEAWQSVRRTIRGNPIMYFTSLAADKAVEDYITCNYLRDTAMQAGFLTNFLPIEELGWNPDTQEFMDQSDRIIKFLAKLYPWEWLVEEADGEIGTHIREMPAANRPRFFEAPWKSILSNKALLVLMYEMFPKCEYILKSSYEASDMGRTYVKKPQFSREGANITIVEKGKTVAETGGEYGGTDLWVYQEFAPLPDFSGHRPVVGSWMVNGYAAGIGIRESSDLITGNLSRFVPHYFTNTKPGFLARINPFGKK